VTDKESVAYQNRRLQELVDEQAERIAELEAAYEIALDQLRKDVDRIAELEHWFHGYRTPELSMAAMMKRIAELEALDSGGE